MLLSDNVKLQNNILKCLVGLMLMRIDYKLPLVMRFGVMTQLKPEVCHVIQTSNDLPA